MGSCAPETIATLGDVAVLVHPRLALLCSVRCPGAVVIKTYDAIRELRDAGIVVAGGFHSPMERECLDFLLRGEQPVIVCAARRLAGLRLGTAARTALADGRLLVLSPFADDVRRTTVRHAQVRNEFVAALANALMVPYADAGGKTAALAASCLERRQVVFTFASAENCALLKRGAQPFNLADIQQALADPDGLSGRTSRGA